MAIDADPQLSSALQGNNAPVLDELATGTLPVTGTLPPALHGSYLRNGPNPQFTPLGRYHPFDGDGMVHAVTLADGAALGYRNRWVESRGLLAEREAGRALFGGLSSFAVPPPEVVERAGFMKNTANTNVVRHAGRLLALLEATLPTELDGELGTLGEYDFGGKLQGAMTAHPKWDPHTGEMLFFGYSPFPPYLRFHIADAGGALVHSVDLDLPGPVMMHDFVVTEHHAVFFDLPAVFDVPAMLQGETGIRWEPERGARIGVLPLRGQATDISWTEVDPFYVFHFLNGHEDVDADGRTTIVVDGCRLPGLPITFGDGPPPEGVRPNLQRWRIDLQTGTVSDEPLDDRPMDFPRLDSRRSGRANRYGYLAHAPGWEPDEVRFTGMVKVDLETGATTEHRYGGRRSGGEPVFAPDPEATAEDAGWLLTFVHDPDTDQSTLRVVDAETMDDEPVAEVQLPRRVPFGFHGNWLPTDPAGLPTR